MYEILNKYLKHFIKKKVSFSKVRSICRCDLRKSSHESDVPECTRMENSHSLSTPQSSLIQHALSLVTVLIWAFVPG